MLVLTRQRNQTIMIGDEIEIKVVDIRGDKVRLGITAPGHVKVHRSEIYEQIQEENQKAARIQPGDIAQIPSPFPRLAEKDASSDLFIKAAVDEAMAGLNEGGLPIGSVLVREGQIIGRGHNRRVQHDDPMAHAEIDCLTNAGRQKTYRDTILYSTLMPCHLCSGAAVQFGIPRVVVGESVNFGGTPQFMRSQGIDVIDLHDAECIQMMGKFIREHPELWHEDIGK
jgi:cytosine/creatinine deaminase